MTNNNNNLSAVANINRFERWLVLVPTISWVASLPVIFFLLRSLEPSPDHSIFDYIAWLASQGLLPYKNSFEVNWPGNILIHITAQQIFGDDSAASRSFDFFIMQSSAIAGAIMLWRNGMKVGASCFLALYPPLYITAGIWMVGQRDIVAAELLLISILFLANPRRRFIGLMAAGFVSAYAFTIRPTYLSFLFGIVLLELFWPADGSIGNRRGRSAGAILTGAALLILALVSIGLATDTLVPWYDQTVCYAMSCYGSQPPPQSMTMVPVELITKSWPWITAFAAGGIVLWALRNDVRNYPLILCLGAVATCVLSFIVQQKGFGYHLAGLLLFLTVLMAVFADTVTKADKNIFPKSGLPGFMWLIPRFTWMLGLITFIFIASVGTFLKLQNNIFVDQHQIFRLTMHSRGAQKSCESYSVAHDAAAFITANVPITGRILPVNCGYRAAFISRRLPSSKFATSTSFGGTQSQCNIGERYLHEYLVDLRANKPDLILVSATQFASASTTLILTAKDSRSALAVVRFASDYRRVAKFGDLLIFAPRRVE